jgi:hypothetical protein
MQQKAEPKPSAKFNLTYSCFIDTLHGNLQARLAPEV